MTLTLKGTILLFQEHTIGKTVRPKDFNQGSASGSGRPEPDRAEPDFGLRAGLRDGFQKNRAPGSARFFARARAQPDVSPIFAYFED